MNSKAVPYEVLKHEAAVLKIEPSYQNIRRIRRSIEIKLESIGTGRYYAKSQRDPNQKYLGRSTFNRTIVELKPVSVWFFEHCRSTFNRPIVELKLR